MVLVCSVPPTINSGFTLVKISEASCKSALSLMNIGPTSSFAHSPSNRPGFGVAARYSSVSSLFHCCRQTAYNAALPLFCPRSTGPSSRYPPFISFEGSQPGSLYYGVCSEQHLSNQRKFWNLFWQFLVVTPAFLFLFQFVIRCSQSRSVISPFVLL